MIAMMMTMIEGEKIREARRKEKVKYLRKMQYFPKWTKFLS